MPTIKDRIILAIGDDTIERPRAIQRAAQTNEHHVVHVLYAMQKQGLVEFKLKKDLYSPGKNLTRIRLTDKGQELRRKLK